MISKRLKLRLRSDESFFKEARRSRFGSLLVYSKKNTTGLQLIIITPKATLRTAVARNNTKRKLYQLLETAFAEQTTLPYSLALVVQAKYAQEFFAEDVAAIAQYFIKQAYVVTQ
ncbi:ribonuclease P protein component [Candidatus Woesebacteria bacterium]|nr:ribonuclease P protein component [Candidatus Woesebacteria bacterium]